MKALFQLKTIRDQIRETVIGLQKVSSIVGEIPAQEVVEEEGTEQIILETQVQKISRLESEKQELEGVVSDLVQVLVDKGVVF